MRTAKKTKSKAKTNMTKLLLFGNFSGMAMTRQFVSTEPLTRSDASLLKAKDKIGKA